MDDMAKDRAEKWQIQESFEITKKEVFKMQREMLANLHFEFLANHFANNINNDGIAHIVLNIPGTMVLLANLIGGIPRLVALWQRAEIREKLMDKKCKIIN